MKIHNTQHQKSGGRSGMGDWGCVVSKAAEKNGTLINKPTNLLKNA